MVNAILIDKPIADASTTEVLISLSLNSTEEVRGLAEKAFAAGARSYMEPRDSGFMWGFEDLDGHIWEMFWMNPEHVE